jgi:ribosomal protein L13E
MIDDGMIDHEQHGDSANDSPGHETETGAASKDAEHKESAASCKADGLSASDCRANGHDAKDMKGAGYDTHEIKGAGFNARECKEAGLNIHECFTANECKDAGLDVHECKQAGFDARECKDAGFNVHESFTANECKDAGLDVHECKQAGFDARECKDAGFNVHECFTAHECKDAGLSAGECKEVGFDIPQMKEAGFTAQEMCDAGFSALEMRGGGCTTGEIVAAELNHLSGSASTIGNEIIKNFGTEVWEQVKGIPVDNMFEKAIQISFGEEAAGWYTSPGFEAIKTVMKPTDIGPEWSITEGKAIWDRMSPQAQKECLDKFNAHLYKEGQALLNKCIEEYKKEVIDRGCDYQNCIGPTPEYSRNYNRLVPPY